jgi:RecB family exonuclease
LVTRAGDAGGQLLLGQMPARLFSCTPSRLTAFDCPRRYRFTYLDRPAPARGAPWAHNTLGAAVHVALHRWWSLPLSRRNPDAGAQLTDRAWQHDGFRDAAQSGRWRRTAAEWVRGYLSDVDPAAEPLGVERTVGVATRRLAVSGRVDRLDDRAGTLVVVDYKTGRRAPSDQDARSSLALALYAAAAARTFRRRCTRVELHHLPSGTVAAADHDEASLARQVERAEATADDIQVATDTLAAGGDPDALFPAVTGPGCSWCDFRRSCPEGAAASAARQPWDGLATEDDE